jgi:hypothetical protein
MSRNPVLKRRSTRILSSSQFADVVGMFDDGVNPALEVFDDTNIVSAIYPALNTVPAFFVGDFKQFTLFYLATKGNSTAIYFQPYLGFSERGPWFPTTRLTSGTTFYDCTPYDYRNVLGAQELTRPGYVVIPNGGFGWLKVLRKATSGGAPTGIKLQMWLTRGWGN